MTISSTTKVRDVALELPQATRIFETLKIDYCCGGDQPLGEACASAGVEVENLERMLAEAERADVQGNGSLDFRKTTLSELVGYILEKHHVYTKFPYIVEMERSALQNRPAPFAAFGTVGNPIRMMMMEHDTAGDILRELRSLSSDYTVPADGCISYQTLYQALEAFEQDLHQHIHLENNILFPRAIEVEANN